MATNPIGNFNPNELTPDQRRTYEMQQELMRQQANGSMMTLMFQHQQQQQKERFDSLSNTLKSGSDARANMINNAK
ncbi:MAG: hypothetical protein M3384_09655 [Acidobacteriota bacterium]|jgi:hypothetical protein|nr:hypothetical protein [Acidobacteriota bacterium]